MINKKASLPIFLGLAVAIGILIGSSINFKNKAVIFSSNTTEAKIKRLINYIQYDYVDKVDTDSLLDDAITNMLVKLDPHSVYIPKEELKDYEIEQFRLEKEKSEADINLLKETFKAEWVDNLNKQVQKHLSNKLLLQTESHYLLSDKGLFFADGIASSLFRIDEL